MADFIDKTSVVEAATIYLGGELVGRDYNVTLPDVVPVTADVPGLMGTMSVPLISAIESMEATVTKVGIDANAARMCSPGKKDLMVKWVQDKVNSAGEVSPVGCMAKFSGIPKNYMPSASIEVGSASEFDCTYEVSVYELYVGGTLVFQVNRMTGAIKAWDGSSLVDYSKSYSDLL